MSNTCKVCDEPLYLEIEDEEGNGEAQTIPDDLQLPCGCHFHWQCLMDQAEDVALSLKCPSCQSQIAANVAGPSVTNPFLHAHSGASVLSRYHNEGGLQEGLDILPQITEEAYLAAHPEARPARAFHVMCGEGDVAGIVELLRDLDEDGAGSDEEPSLTPAQLLRYQDPLNQSKSGLHVAVEKGQEEVLWLLLWLASSLPSDLFPMAAVHAAQSMGVQRPQQSHADDIRLLRDSSGRTAESIAAEMDGIWTFVLQAGALHSAA